MNERIKVIYIKTLYCWSVELCERRLCLIKEIATVSYITRRPVYENCILYDI